MIQFQEKYELNLGFWIICEFLACRFRWAIILNSWSYFDNILNSILISNLNYIRFV